MSKVESVLRQNQRHSSKPAITFQSSGTKWSYRYGIGSFVYRARRPFDPLKLYRLIEGNFILLQEEADDDEDNEDDEDDDEGSDASSASDDNTASAGDEVEDTCVEHFFYVYLGELGLNDLRCRVQCLDVGLDPSQGFLVDSIDLVNDDDISKFYLIGEKIGDGALVFIRYFFTTEAILEEFGGIELGEEAEGIDDSDHSVDTGNGL